MTTEGAPMTVTDRTDATEQEFRDRIAAFDTAPTPPEVREAAVVEEVARAIRGEWLRVLHGWDDWGAAPERVRENYRRLAAAAVAAYRAVDGGAEEAMRRVTALLTRAYPVIGARVDGTTLVVKADDLRAALAPQADR